MLTRSCHTMDPVVVTRDPDADDDADDGRTHYAAPGGHSVAIPPAVADTLGHPDVLTVHTTLHAGVVGPGAWPPVIRLPSDEPDPVPSRLTILVLALVLAAAMNTLALLVRHVA
jgi:hypothetical protein